MKKWSQEKTDELKSQKCKKPRVCFIFFYHFFHFFVLCSESLDFAKCSSFFPNFLVENAAKHRKSMNKNKENDEKWIEMMKNGQCTIKIWKANDKKMKNKWKKWKNWAKKRQMGWNPKNAKNLEFFSFIFHLFIMFFSFFCPVLKLLGFC